MAVTADGERATALRAGRERILSAPRESLPAAPLRDALCELYEMELGRLADEAGIGPGSGFALIAFGGLGRREVLPHSDLDLVLVHERRPDRDVGELADALWYPLWDSGVGLDHSVRTVDQCLAVAAADVSVGLSLLDARVIAGDADLGALVVDGARRQWRDQIASRFDDLVDAAAARRHRAGVIAHRSEPDLKNGAGGLRDAQLVAALGLAHLSDGRPVVPGGMARAHRLVLDARTELHRVSGRPREVLHAEYGDEVGEALGLGDRFDLARALSDASRTIAFTADQAIRGSCAALSSRGLTGLLRRSPVRRPLDDGVVEHAGEVTLARAARVADDPWLALRVAAAAARFGLPIATSTLGVLAERCPVPDGQWPAEALSDLLVLLGSGEAQIPVHEALDRCGLWERLLPEWAGVRDLPARDRAHIYTVDRHLVQTAVEASRLTTSVARADLLLLAALLHDLGKSRDGDHSENGADMIRPICARMGLGGRDTETLTRIVRHHLLLSATAARRDPADPATAEAVLTALDRDAVSLDVLAALTEADSLATGPTVWTTGRAGAHAALVAACGKALGPRPAAVQAPTVNASRRHGPPDVVVDLRAADTGTTHEVTLVVPGGGRSLAVTAEVLAAHRLEIVDAEIDLRPPGGMRARMTVSTRFGDPVDGRVLRQDLRRSIDSGLPGPLRAALSRGAALAIGPPQARSSVLISHRTDADGVLMEVRSEDRPGLFARVVAAIIEAGARIDWVVVRTRGAAVEDVFALSGPGAVLSTAGQVEALLPRRDPTTPAVAHADTL
ncbi:UTP--GlnB (protein PII) uridylyltransferase GlnD [Dietzia kunjamensis]|uniref:[protein-PII] uridylyltransferase n=1 Tax=Dietzia kunjamensis TaxID=322509 RepID=UPI000E74A84C|nr:MULTISPECIES: [protein-PII] uridylyltransferase [Dietzia]MVZ89295.1 [protein-PII] uridylyltransferase [Microbacter sp. ANSKLAB05]RKE66607.1 UTP--GlnB (protein PII) uridylyltransferase GlnD [Dietzia kunjamensis]USX44408.1 [protein-PII] uridylyltransferase [Dietzia kunjamensis]